MNEIANRSSTELSSTSKNAFEQYSEAVNQNRIVGDLLKFSKGEWSAGQYGEEIEEGAELVANMDELMVGWIKWEDNKPTDMIMGRVAEGYVPPKRDSLGDQDKDRWETDDHGDPRDPWQLTNYLILKEPDTDKLYTFATSSKGGMGAIGKLCGSFGKHMRQKPDELPIIALNVGSYKHSNKAYGKIYFPELDIVSWRDKAEFAAALASEAAANDASSQGEEDEPAAKPAAAAPTAKASGRGKSAPAAETRF